MQSKLLETVPRLPLLAASRAICQHCCQTNMTGYTSNPHSFRSPASRYRPRPRQLSTWIPSSRNADNGKKRPTGLTLVGVNLLQKLKRKIPPTGTNRSQGGYWSLQCSGTSHSESEAEEPEGDRFPLLQCTARVEA